MNVQHILCSIFLLCVALCVHSDTLLMILSDLPQAQPPPAHSSGSVSGASPGQAQQKDVQTVLG